MGAIAIGGFAQGLAQGLKLGSDLNDAEEKRKILKEQAARDTERFGWEREESMDKSRRRTMLAEGEKEYADADSLFASGQILSPKTQPSQAISAPSSAAPASGEAESTPVASSQGVTTQQIPAQSAAAPRAAIATPTAPAPAEGAQPKVNPFKGDGEGKYQDMNAAWDRYYEMKSNALQKVFMAQGNYKDAMAVPKMMRELRDTNWSEKVGASLAAMAGGAPGAREAFAKVYSNINDGWELDPTKGKYDADKGTWIGLERVNADGKRETFDMSGQQAAMLSMKYKDPGEVVKFMLDRSDKNRQLTADERRASASEKTADAAMLDAKNKGPYYSAYANRLNSLSESEKSAASQKASVEAIARLFPEAHKEYKPEELMLEKDKGAAKMRAKQEALEMNNMTVDLAAMNPKADIRALASLARKMRANDGITAEKDSNGRIFTTYGGVKYYLP